MVKKTIILLFFCNFTLLVCGEKNILPTNSPEPVFLAPWSLSRSKKNTRSRSRSRLGKNQEPEPLEEKNQEPETLKKFAGSPALQKSRNRSKHKTIFLNV